MAPADNRVVTLADKASVASVDKSSGTSEAKTSAVSANKTSVVCQDIPTTLQRWPQRDRVGNGVGMSWETTDVLSADTTDALAADTTDVLSVREVGCPRRILFSKHVLGIWPSKVCGQILRKNSVPSSKPEPWGTT